MAFSISTFNGHSVVRADGELDVSTASQLRQTITTAFDEGGGKVIVDLTAVTFMDSTTLGVLIGAHNRVRETGGALASSARTTRSAGCSGSRAWTTSSPCMTPSPTPPPR